MIRPVIITMDSEATRRLRPRRYPLLFVLAPDAKGTAVQRLFVFVLLQISAATAEAAPQSTCPDLPATAVVERLSDLPPAIREDLTSVYKDMGERESPLLQTDAPTAAEESYPTSRFFQAILIKNEWYVQYELTYGGRRTLSYIRGTNGQFQRFPGHYFGGPFCEVLKAALHGVVTPGGLNF